MPVGKTLNVYLPQALYGEIARQSKRTGRTKGEVVRDRLTTAAIPPTGELIADLFGVADDLPRSLSTAKDTEFRDYGADGHR